MMEWREAAMDSGDHVQRIVDMYRELGYEIRLEEVEPEDVGRCHVCYKAGDERIYRVHVRCKQELEE